MVDDVPSNSSVSMRATRTVGQPSSAHSPLESVSPPQQSRRGATSQHPSSQQQLGEAAITSECRTPKLEMDTVVSTRGPSVVAGEDRSIGTIKPAGVERTIDTRAGMSDEVKLLGADSARATNQVVRMLGEWRVGQVVGKGTSGRVRLGRSVITGSYAAIKKVKKLPVGHKHHDSIVREISIMKLVDHPHVLKLKDVFKTENHFYLVTEYCAQGECYDYIVGHALSRATVHRWFAQLVSALGELHSIGIAHRDIKFENMFLFTDVDGYLSVKLGDLGMASYQPQGCLLDTSCGSPHYAAPEVIMGIAYDGMKADLWSTGVVLYALHARQLPFDNDHIPTLLSTIKNGVYTWHTSIHATARDLISKLLLLDPDQRISLQDIQDHTFLTRCPYRPRSARTTSCFADAEDWAIDQMINHERPLDVEVLESLRIVLRAESIREISEEVKAEPGAARTFYRMLKQFSRRLEPQHRPLFEPSLLSSSHRSLSLPDLSQVVEQRSTLIKVYADNPSVENKTSEKQRRVPLAPLSSNVPSSAPPTAKAIGESGRSRPPTESVESLVRPSRPKRAASFAGTRLTTRPDSDLENRLNNNLNQRARGRSKETPQRQNIGSIVTDINDISYSTFEAETESLRSLNKKRSLQAKIRSFFKRDESSHGRPSAPCSPAAAATNEALSPSRSQVSLMKRSTGYSSLQQAINGITSGILQSSAGTASEFGVLDAQAKQSTGSSKRKSWRRRSSLLLRRTGARDSISSLGVAESPVLLRDRSDSTAAADRSSGKKRPTPLHLVSSTPIVSPSTPTSVDYASILRPYGIAMDANSTHGIPSPLDLTSESSSRAAATSLLPPIGLVGPQTPLNAVDPAFRSAFHGQPASPLTPSQLSALCSSLASSSPLSTHFTAHVNLSNEHNQLDSTAVRAALASLEKDNAELRAENDALRARIAFMEEGVERAWSELQVLRHVAATAPIRAESSEGRLLDNRHGE